MVLQLLLGGLSIGAIYSLIALGLVMLLRSLDLFNFVQGEMVMAGGFLGLFLYQVVRLPFLASFLIAMAGVALVGLAIERFGIRPLKSPNINSMICATIAASIILQNIAMMVGGPEPVPFASPFAGKLVTFAGSRLSLQQIVIILSALSLMVLLQVFFYLTKTGLCLRAVMVDRQAASMMGVNVVRVISVTFALSAALGGAAGILVAPVIFVAFDMGIIAFKAFAAAVLGGLYSFTGAIVGGLALGVIETFTGAYISSAYRDVLTYSILIAVLIVRPRGIFSLR